MESTALVALRSSLRVLGLAGAELAEVLGGFGDGGGEEFDFYAAEGFACERVEVRRGWGEKGEVGRWEMAAYGFAVG